MTFPDTYQHSFHAEDRRIERGFTRAEVEEVVREGRVIEEYEDEYRGPSALLLHWINEKERPVHVVAAPKKDITVIVTVYDPSDQPDTWNDNYTKRQTDE